MSRISSSRMERPPRNSCYYNPPPPSSFSSTLLDTIYRSFDESHHLSSQSTTNLRKKQEPDIFQELTTLKKQQNNYDSNYHAAATMKKSSSVYQVRGSMMDIHHLSSSMEEDKGGVLLSRGQQRSKRSNGRRRFSLGSVESISSSSDDVDGPFYRDSLCQATTPAEEDCNNNNKKKNKKNNSKLLLKPIRTSFSVMETDQKLSNPSPRQRIVDETPRGTKNNRFPEQQQQQRLKSEGKSSSTAKSRAMKFYGDLKRMKQPISPGGRLATFLNSLFSVASNGVVGGGSGGAKKQRISTSSDGGGRWDRESSNLKSPAFTATTPSTNCSTASSSLSRSCLSSKSTSTSSTTGKRSVRFCPVSVIIDEDMRQKSFSSEEELIRLRVMEKNRRVEEAARDLLKNYQDAGSDGGNHRTMRDLMDVVKGEEEEDEDDDDGASCCSSDLFELENLLEIGRHHRNEVDRYREELPVYETTHVGTNRAIASGLIV